MKKNLKKKIVNLALKFLVVKKPLVLRVMI